MIVVPSFIMKVLGPILVILGVAIMFCIDLMNGRPNVRHWVIVFSLLLFFVPGSILVSRSLFGKLMTKMKDRLGQSKEK